MKIYCSEINEVYTETRYPSDLGLIPNGTPSLETVKNFQSLANDIFRASKTEIEKR